MTLLKTSFFNSIAVGVKLLVGLFLNKVLAVFVGPAGYAIIGQFQNAVTMITTFASGAINNGVVKYTAEYHYDEGQQVRVWQTAARIAITCSVLIAAFIALFNRQLAQLFLKRAEYGSIFLFFAVFLLFFVLNALLLAILNGKRDVGRYVLANISGSLVMAAVTGALTKGIGLYGALLALSINQSITFIVTLFLCRRTKWFRLHHIIGGYDRDVARKLGNFAFMALTSAAVVPLAQLLIRNHLGQKLGWTAAGYWQGVWKISDMYLLVITTTLSVYYLPRISEINNPAELRHEIFNGYKLILPVTALGAITIYLTRDWIVHLLFTKDFVPMTEFFGMQLAGDVVKIASWLLGYVLWGKALTKIFVITEIAFSALFVALAFILTDKFGIYGVTGSYLATYLLYFCVLLAVLRRTKHI